jgi:hypothetical protein
LAPSLCPPNISRAFLLPRYAFPPCRSCRICGGRPGDKGTATFESQQTEQTKTTKRAKQLRPTLMSLKSSDFTVCIASINPWTNAWLIHPYAFQFVRPFLVSLYNSDQTSETPETVFSIAHRKPEQRKIQSRSGNSVLTRPSPPHLPPLVVVLIFMRTGS